jgi:hypothetical protein
LLLDVAEVLEAERVGEPARRVDREDEYLPAETRGGGDSGRGGDRRLADTTGTAEHDDLFRREQ